MKASDYIVEYLIVNGVTDVFGYPGGMVIHLMDSLSRYSDHITAHSMYHEQGAAFAACGYAQAAGRTGVAYATSGPGATNLVTGICNAYFDSIPVVFITGNVNTFEAKGNLQVRQRGFQETDIVKMVEHVTKYAVYVDSAEKLPKCLENAFRLANEGRKGPVLLDIPMNIYKADIHGHVLQPHWDDVHSLDAAKADDVDFIIASLNKSSRPVFLFGNGVKDGAVCLAKKLAEKYNIPSVTSMLAVDTLAGSSMYNGFIGAYGDRLANFIVEKSDLLISFGSRLDIRQVGAKRENFAPNAKIIRIDIDEGELAYSIRDDITIRCDASSMISALLYRCVNKDYSEWVLVCKKIRKCLADNDSIVNSQISRLLMNEIGRSLLDDTIITTDVGQNQVWVAQSLSLKNRQRVFFSGGHGAMGYSLPAAIGAYFASRCIIYSFNGDGGFQMNMQELQTISRENIPVKVIIFNNYALGMIRHFQEMYFDSNFFQTIDKGGYTVPNFRSIAVAYGLEYHLITDVKDIRKEMFTGNYPAIVEVCIRDDTYVYPKLEFGKANNDQEPLLSREIFDYLNAL